MQMVFKNASDWTPVSSSGDLAKRRGVAAVRG